MTGSEAKLIRSVWLESKSGRSRAAAEIYLDCTGDGDLAARAGAPYQQGRPQDGLTQPMTLNFRMAGVDEERMPPREEINRLYAQAKARGEVDCPRENVLYFPTPTPGVIHFNTTRVVGRSGTDAADLTAAELEGRRQVREMLRFLVDKVPGFERAYLQKMGAQIGVRESRRIGGQYQLTQEDILGARKFDDVIALGNYDIDIHNPAGAGTVIRSLPEGEWYTIPYRCLLPLGIGNLLVAGRCISATHEAHASIRIMPIGAALGQAAGTAAALCLEQGMSPPELPVPVLQQRLREQGANLGRQKAEGRSKK